MKKIDLRKLLNEIIEAYGKNEGYVVPAIIWSKENMVSRYGEYQYWRNLIIVSNLLNTDKVSEKAIKYVIFHEYTHQLYAEHNESFCSRMKMFKGGEKCEKELDEYINSLQDFPIHTEPDLQINENEEVVFCELPFNEKDIDSYWNHFLYYNHWVTGFLPHDIPDRFCQKTTKQIVWTVKMNNLMYIVGWCKNVNLYSKMQEIDLSDIGMDKIEYQFKYKQNMGKTILPCNVFIGLYENEIPETLKKQGICASGDIEQKIFLEIIDLINTYSQDFIEYGIADNSLECMPEIETEDVDVLLDMAKHVDNGTRALAILNKAVSLEKSYRTYLQRALAFNGCWIFDRAFLDFAAALQFEEDSKEKVSKKEIISLMKDLEKAIKAI